MSDIDDLDLITCFCPAVFTAHTLVFALVRRWKACSLLYLSDEEMDEWMVSIRLRITVKLDTIRISYNPKRTRVSTIPLPVLTLNACCATCNACLHVISYNKELLGYQEII